MAGGWPRSDRGHPRAISWVGARLREACVLDVDDRGRRRSRRGRGNLVDGLDGGGLGLRGGDQATGQRENAAGDDERGEQELLHFWILLRSGSGRGEAPAP